MSQRLTEQDIHAACVEMVAMGEKPTSLGLLEHFGRGGLGTITKYLRSWEKTDEAKSAQVETLPAVVPLPERLSKDGDDLLKKLWHVAKSISDAEIEGERELMKQAKLAAEEKITEAYEYSEIQSNNLEKLDDQLNAINGENEALKATLSTTTQQLKTALEIKADLEATLSEALTKVSSLTTSVASLETNLALIKQEKQQLSGVIVDKDQELEKTRLDHQHIIEKSEAAHAQAILKLEASQEKIIIKLEKEAKEALDRLENAHSSALQAINIAHQQALASLENAGKEAAAQYKDTIADLNKDKETLSLRLKELQAIPPKNTL